MDKLYLGIDFGTSTNFVTKYDFVKKVAVPVANMGGHGESNLLENSVYFESSGNVLIGGNADKKGVWDPLNYFRNIKKFIAQEQKTWKVPHLDYREYSAKDIAGFIFREIKEKVETNENKKIEGVVLTVPYSYTDSYRRRLSEASERAGLKVLQIIEEPVAAAVAFGLFQDLGEHQKKETVLVFDLGGGTLDTTIFEFSGSSQRGITIEVLNTDGVKSLGGEDIDQLMLFKFRDRLLDDKINFSNSKEEREIFEELRKLAKETKEELSTETTVEVYKNFSISGEDKELEFDLEEEEFESWLNRHNFIGRIEDALDRCLIDVDGRDLEVEDIDRVILVGGGSNIPLVHKMIKRYFGDIYEVPKSPEELVGLGAGLIAGLIHDDNQHYKIIRKVSKQIGVAHGNKLDPVLFKNTPYGKESTFYKVGIENRTVSERLLSLYEGDSIMVDDCEFVGVIRIDLSVIMRGHCYISLNKDTVTGRLKYQLYNEKKKKIKTDYINN